MVSLTGLLVQCVNVQSGILYKGVKIPITLIKANEQGTFASQIKQLVKNDTNLVMSPMPLLELLAKEQMNEQFEELIKRQQEAVRFFTALGGKEKFDNQGDPFFAFLRPTIRISTKFNKFHACRSNPGESHC